MSAAPPKAERERDSGARELAWQAGLSVLLTILILGAIPVAVVLQRRGRLRRCQQAIASAQARRLTSSQAADEWGASLFETFTASQAEELRRGAKLWPHNVDSIISNARKAQTTRVYLAGHMVYFVFFSPDDRIQAFTCVED